MASESRVGQDSLSASVCRSGVSCRSRPPLAMGPTSAARKSRAAVAKSQNKCRNPIKKPSTNTSPREASPESRFFIFSFMIAIEIYAGYATFCCVNVNAIAAAFCGRNYESLFSKHDLRRWSQLTVK